MASTAKPVNGMPGNYAPAYTTRKLAGGASVLPVDNEIAVGGARGANPVNSTVYGSRADVPMSGGVESRPGVIMARNLNPRLNTVPWAISMAEPRSEDRMTQKRHNRKKGYNA